MGRNTVTPIPTQRWERARIGGPKSENIGRREYRPFSLGQATRLNYMTGVMSGFPTSSLLLRKAEPQNNGLRVT